MLQPANGATDRRESPKGRPAIRQTAPHGPNDEVELLRGSRARVMAMANHQRRDIERHLHDGVQQDLIALAVNLQLAEEAAGSSPAALKDLLGTMRHDVHDAIEGVRTLARSVYPPLLLDLGLAAALRSVASASDFAMRVEAAADRYPADIEATVYFCCVEAVQAIAASGSDGSATVRVWRDPGTLMFEVIAEAGTSARNENLLLAVATGMDDRVGAVGGTLTLVADASGARVHGALPLDGEP